MRATKPTKTDQTQGRHAGGGLVAHLVPKTRPKRAEGLTTGLPCRGARSPARGELVLLATNEVAPRRNLRLKRTAQKQHADMWGESREFVAIHDVRPSSETTRDCGGSKLWTVKFRPPVAIRVRSVLTTNKNLWMLSVKIVRRGVFELFCIKMRFCRFCGERAGGHFSQKAGGSLRPGGVRGTRFLHVHTEAVFFIPPY